MKWSFCDLPDENDRDRLMDMVRILWDKLGRICVDIILLNLIFFECDDPESAIRGASEQPNNTLLPVASG